MALVAACSGSNLTADDAGTSDDATTSGDASMVDAGADGGIDSGLDGPSDGPSDGAPDAAPDAPPAGGTDDLVTTGLCIDDACTAINPGVTAYEPRWHLWSDGESKRRWIELPPGTQINTSNMDYWQFPVGTKVWKEFTRNGVRVETRYMVRTGPATGDWQFLGYEWNAAQTHATAMPGGDQNVNGTPHDIPSAATCLGCHGNNATPVLGFSAFQLDYGAPAGSMDLDDAIASGWISQPPGGASSPHLPLPGNATDQAALGYVHVNCGHCHNSDSQLTSHPMFRIETARIATMQSTRLYSSTVNVVAQNAFEGATIVAKPADPDNSVIIKRTTTTDLPHRMPALGIETVDPAGQQILRAWISALP